MSNDIRRAVDTTLSGLTVSAARQAQLVRTAKEQGCQESAARRDNRLHLHLTLSLSFGMPHLLAALAVIVLVTLLPLLQSPRKDPFVRFSSEDGQSYFVTGAGVPTPQPGAIASSDSIPPGSYSGLSLEEADRVYGSKIPRLTWLPEGAALTHLSAEVYDMDRSVVIRYQIDRGPILFTIYDFFTDEIGMIWFPQNDEGEYITLANGAKAYITTNISKHSIVWQEGYTVYHISGEVTLEELLRMADSIE